MSDHIDLVLRSGTIPELWELHVARMESYGFDRILYGATHFRTTGFMGDISDALVLLKGDQAYTDVYIGDELYMHSPANEWATHNLGAASWGDFARSYNVANLSTERRNLLELNVKWGLVAGYTISLIDSNSRSKGVIGLCARPGLDQAQADEVWGEFGKEIEMLCNVFHLKICTLPHNGQRRPLTSRQREALRWYGDGKTTRDIAQIMGLSPATVEKHLRCAREALNVETTAHAVQKATSLNQLFA